MAESSFFIQSHKGPYKVDLVGSVGRALACLGRPADDPSSVYLIDARVAELYSKELGDILKTGRVVRVAATEENKSLEKMPEIIRGLLELNVRRDQCLIAIGGGIIQDISCFIASNLFRGMSWSLIPTTLLAQADSCIGSKSSINLGSWKNLLGNFTPPEQVIIATDFLNTLDPADVRSGVGEMIKVHIIDGPASFAKIEGEFDTLFTDPSAMLTAIQRSLKIKQRFIEADEFDKGIRNVMNYGHSFGHAIESATDFGVPHGIAVTIGMDMANFTAWKLGRIGEEPYKRYSALLRRNAGKHLGVPVPLDSFIGAIAKDKKNVGSDLTLILPDADLIPQKTRVPNDARFRALCSDYLMTARA